MKDVVVIGAGKIGATVAGLLASMGDYQVTLADRSPEVLGNLDQDERIRIMPVDAEDSLKLVDLLNGQFAIINAAPFRLTKHIAEAARAAGTHYLDLTEDVVSTRRVRELAANANTAFIPQCGLAPGFVSIVAFDMAKGFEVLDSVRLRVGALPQYPSNAINYNLTWSTDGVINEYCEACEAIVNGVRREVFVVGRDARVDGYPHALTPVREKGSSTGGPPNPRKIAPTKPQLALPPIKPKPEPPKVVADDTSFDARFTAVTRLFPFDDR